VVLAPLQLVERTPNSYSFAGSSPWTCTWCTVVSDGLPTWVNSVEPFSRNRTSESEGTSVRHETVTEPASTPSWIPTSLIVGAGAAGSHGAVAPDGLSAVSRVSRGRCCGPRERRLKPGSTDSRPMPGSVTS
jgi:hypothetical protein